MGMDISGIRRTEGHGNYIPAPAHREGGSSFSQSFHQQQDNQERQKYQEQIEALFGDLSRDAQELLKGRNLSRFEAYRQKITFLLGEILQHAYLFEAERVRDGNGRERIYATIAVVDEKLDRLGTELLSENQEQLGLLSRIDEIRGLILDLFS